MEVKKPIIDIWYGHTQSFGRPGLLSDNINIQGTIISEHEIISSTYRLNSGDNKSFTLGPDNRRLSKKGDFNIEIEAILLKPGDNSISIECMDKVNNVSTTVVILDFKNQQWPIPYLLNPTETDSIQDLVQIIDGQWTLGNGAIRTATEYIGYDRIIALGDQSWDNYEIQFQLVVHKVDEDYYDSTISKNPGFGVIIHWAGHTHFPIKNLNIKSGWEPYGNMLMYELKKDGRNEIKWVEPPPYLNSITQDNLKLEMDQYYNINLRVQDSTSGTLYQAKIWKTNASITTARELYSIIPKDNLSHGGVAIFAHHLDISISNIKINNLNRSRMRKWIYKLYAFGIYVPLILVLGYGLIKLFQSDQSIQLSNSSTTTSMILILLAILIDLSTRNNLAYTFNKLKIQAKTALFLIQLKNITVALLHTMAWIIIIKNIH